MINESQLSRTSHFLTNRLFCAGSGKRWFCGLLLKREKKKKKRQERERGMQGRSALHRIPFVRVGILRGGVLHPLIKIVIYSDVEGGLEAAAVLDMFALACLQLLLCRLRKILSNRAKGSRRREREGGRKKVWCFKYLKLPAQ